MRSKNIAYFKYKNKADITIGEVSTNSKKNIVISISIALLFFIAILSGTLYIFKDVVVDLVTRPKIILTANEIELNVGKDKFEPKKYIQSIPENYETELPKESEVNIAVVGEYNVPYTLITRYNRPIYNILKVRVVDKEAPQLILEKEEDTIEQGNNFSCDIYIKEVSDNYDKLTKENVQCSSAIDFENSTQDIEYFVKDNNGNSTKKILHLKINKKKAAEEAPVSNTLPQYREEPNQPQNNTYVEEIYEKGIFGVHDVSFPIGASGSEILNALASGVSGSSDISIDASNVNTTQAGSYPVYFNGADGSSATSYVHIQ